MLVVCRMLYYNTFLVKCARNCLLLIFFKIVKCNRLQNALISYIFGKIGVFDFGYYYPFRFSYFFTFFIESPHYILF